MQSFRAVGIKGIGRPGSGQLRATSVCRQAQWLLWMWVLVTLPCLASAQAGNDLDAVASDVAVQLAQRFPHLKGEVVDVQGEQLYVSLGARNQVLEGMRLSVFREGKELKSPTTGNVFGRLEEDLGTVTVTQVAETYAVASPENAAYVGRVQAGDKVRITAGRLSLALFPLGGQTEDGLSMAAVADAVQRSLNATGRFDVVPRARLTLWLSEKGLTHEDAVVPGVMAEAAIALGATYLAQPVLRRVDDETVVELRVFAPSRPQSPVTTAVAVLSETEARRQRSATSPVPQPSAAVSAPSGPAESPPVAAVPTRPASEESTTTLQSLLNADPLALERSYLPLSQLATELRGFDAADIDGDGLTELVMLSDTKVLLYQLQENQLVAIASYSDRRPGTLLSAQLVRFVDEKTLGVVVNRYNPGRRGMDSFFLALNDNQLTRQQKGLRDILLAVDMDGDGVNESIWGQRFDRDGFFRRGQVRQYELRDGRLKRQRKLSLPPVFRATGAALAQLDGPGNRHLVFVDERHNLQVYDGKNRRWKSRANVGGSYVFAAVHIQRSPQIAEQVQFDFEAIPAVMDIDGDGIDEVLVPQNQARLGVVPNLNLYSGGHVVLMRQTPQGFALSPISPEFDGIVSGVALLKGHTPGILVAVSKWEGVLKQEKETILYLYRM